MSEMEDDRGYAGFPVISDYPARIRKLEQLIDSQTELLLEKDALLAELRKQLSDFRDRVAIGEID